MLRHVGGQIPSPASSSSTPSLPPIPIPVPVGVAGHSDGPSLRAKTHSVTARNLLRRAYQKKAAYAGSTLHNYRRAKKEEKKVTNIM